jgi:hypothetical protein
MMIAETTTTVWSASASRTVGKRAPCRNRAHRECYPVVTACLTWQGLRRELRTHRLMHPPRKHGHLGEVRDVEEIIFL